MEIIIGLSGVILGILLTEVLRRLNRIEELNKQIFNRRLEDYIDLYDLIVLQYSNFSEIRDEFKKFNREEKLEVVSNYIFPIINFNDSTSFFISDELSVQTSTLFMGSEDINEDELDGYILNRYKQTLEMIKSESGMNHVNKNIKRILKYKHKSDIVNYYRKLKKESNKNNKRNRDYT